MNILTKKIKLFMREMLCKISRIRKTTHKHTILFVGSRFHELIIKLSNDYNCVVLNPKWNKDLYVEYIKYGIKLYVRDKFDLEDYFQFTEEGIKSYNPEQSIERARKGIKKLLEKSRIEFIILQEDILPNNNVIIEEAKKLHILTATYMHGGMIVTKNQTFGLHSDFLWVWGQYYKDEMIRIHKKDPNSIFVAGYPDSIKPIQKCSNKNILFIGAGYTKKQYESWMETYAKITLKIAKVCVDNSISFTYRPHPAEDINEIEKRFKDYPEIRISRNSKLLEDFKAHSVIIGGYSTAMIEATIYKRIAYQINWKKELESTANEFYVKDRYLDVNSICQIIENENIFMKSENICEEYLIMRPQNIFKRIKEEIDRLVVNN